jgi:hypothetical protein
MVALRTRMRLRPAPVEMSSMSNRSPFAKSMNAIRSRKVRRRRNSSPRKVKAFSS